MQYPNFFETVKEARMRLENTVVMYDGKPYYCLTVGDDTEDGIYDVYLDQFGEGRTMAVRRYTGIPLHFFDEPGENGLTKSAAMRGWYADNGKEETGVLLKKMNDPKFNKFRPFPLGMVNYYGALYYTQRGPTRNMQQGLTDPMVRQWCFTPDGEMRINFTSDEMYDMLIGNYPTAEESLEALLDPDCGNKGAAFHRDFGLYKAAGDFMFLAYKQDVVGIMPEGNFDKLVLSTTFQYTKEVIEEAGLFQSIEFK